MDVADPFVNIGNTAGLYSQIAGVLAGFAFTGLLLYLNQPPGQTDSHNARQENSTQEAGADGTYDTRRDVAVVLYNTLGALVICAILYGELAGGDPDSGIAFSSVLLNGLAFSLAILGMFYATALAATPFSHLNAMVAAARFLVGAIGPTICMALIASAALDMDMARCTGKATPQDKECDVAEQLAVNRPYGLALLLTGLIALLSLALLLWFRRPAKRPRPWIPLAIAWVILIAAIGTVGVNVYLTSQPSDYLLPDSALRAMLFLTFLVLGCFSAMAAHSCHHVGHKENDSKENRRSAQEQDSSPPEATQVTEERSQSAPLPRLPESAPVLRPGADDHQYPGQNEQAGEIV